MDGRIMQATTKERKKGGCHSEGGGRVGENKTSSLWSDLFAKSGHNESIMSALIGESVWGLANWL